MSGMHRGGEFCIMRRRCISGIEWRTTSKRMCEMMTTMKRRRIVGLASLALALAAGLPGMAPAPAAASTARLTSRVILAGLDNGQLFRSATGITNWRESDHGLPLLQVWALAVVPDGSRIYAATSFGLYISTDGGVNWKDPIARSSDLYHEDFSALALDSAHAHYVYALTFEGTFRTSKDDGHHWTVTSQPLKQDIERFSLAVSRQRPALMLASGVSLGVFRSVDAGAHWSKVSIAADFVETASFSPATADVAFAATNRGIFESIDAGKSWQPARRGIPAETAFQLVVVDPANPAIVIAGTENGLLYRSRDGGTSWSYPRQIGDTLVGRIESILFDVARPGVVFAGTEAGAVIFRSVDNGGHWSRFFTGFDPNGGLNALAMSGPQ
jgi:photosystem II stability/assembly factor-like uncharacterized protein